MASMSTWQMIVYRAAYNNRAALALKGLRMTAFVYSSGLAAQTLAQIVEIDRRIASLIELRDGLKRVFRNVSHGDDADTPEPRLTGTKRAMMEYVILELLEAANGSPLKTRELFNGARAVSAHLNYATFRSYLHRLKKRGTIASEDNAYASWKLCNVVPIAANQNAGRPLNDGEAAVVLALEYNPDSASVDIGGMRAAK
jgi:predicted transcriptional regulator